MTTASLLAIAAFSLVVLVSAFSWICLLELRHPMYPSHRIHVRAGKDRRQFPVQGWPGWLERRSSERRRDLQEIEARG